MNKDSKYAVQVVMYAIDWHYGDLGAHYPDGLKDKWLLKGRSLNNYLELGFYIGEDHQPRYFNLLDWEQEKDKSPVAEFTNLNDLLNKGKYTDLNKLLKNPDLSKRVYVSGHAYGGGDGFSTLDDAAESKEVSNKSIAQALKELFAPIVPDSQGNYLAKVTVVAIGCNFANDTAEHLSRSSYSKSNANRLMRSIIVENYGYWPDGVHGCFPWNIADDTSGYSAGGSSVTNKLNHPILKDAKYSQPTVGSKYIGGVHKGFTTRYVFFLEMQKH